MSDTKLGIVWTVYVSIWINQHASAASATPEDLDLNCVGREMA